jgi:hypothetical protein
MRRLLVVLASLPVASLLSAGACEPPPKKNNNNNNNNNNNGAATCNVGGLELPLPEEDAVRPAGGDIDLSCVGAPEQLPAGDTVRLQGCVDIFGLGGRAKPGIKVAIFDDDQDPQSDTPAHGEVEIATIVDASGLDCAGADADTAACLSLGCDKEGAYVIENIPVHVPLTMKVYKPNDDTVIDTYTFGIVFDHGEEVAVDGVVSYEANLIFRSTYDSIPTLAGRIVDGQQTIGDGQGRAVIAGEIHDCADKIVQGASVSTDQLDSSTSIAYFDGNTEDPKPDLSRLSTNTDGLYVLLNVTTEPGKNVHTVYAGMRDPSCTSDTDCQCLSMSSRTIKVYPDSVSIATLRGDLPTL